MGLRARFATVLAQIGAGKAVPKRELLALAEAALIERLSADPVAQKVDQIRRGGPHLVDRFLELSPWILSTDESEEAPSKKSGGDR